MSLEPIRDNAEQEQENLQILAKHIEKLANEPATKTLRFTIKGPMSTAVQLKNGEYRVRSFIGGEDLSIVSSYLGKKGKIIIVFKNNSPVTDYRFIEMDMDKAIENMDNQFKVFLQDAIKNGFSADGVKLKTAEEASRINADKYKNDERYGLY